MLNKLGVLEFVQSRKAKSMMLTQAALVAVSVAVMIYAQGDPEKIAKIMDALGEVLMLIAGTGAVHVAGQSMVDARTAENGQVAPAPQPPPPAQGGQ